MSYFGSLGGVSFGQLAGIGSGIGSPLQSQLRATDRAMLDARLAFSQREAGITFKAEPDGLREELQAETDEWLKEAIK